MERVLIDFMKIRRTYDDFDFVHRFVVRLNEPCGEFHGEIQRDTNRVENSIGFLRVVSAGTFEQRDRSSREEGARKW